MTENESDDLFEFDREIALMRGWYVLTHGSDDMDEWCAPDSATDEEREYAFNWRGTPGEKDWEVGRHYDMNPPPFSSSWALAGPLLEELQGDAPHDMTLWRLAGAWHVDANGSCHSGATPCEAIARAWVAWRRGRA